MSARDNQKTDPLVEAPRPDRVAYALGMMLGAEDFEAEQTYHRGRLAWALAAVGGGGTALGLRVRHQPAVAIGADPALPNGRAEELGVAAGLAVDGLGRIIEVPRRACIRLQPWYESQDPGALEAALRPEGVVADLFLRFVACGRGKTPAFRGAALDALDGVADARIRDGHELKLVLRLPGEAPPADVGPALDGLAPGNRATTLREFLLDRAWPPRAPDAESDWIAPRFDPFAVFLARVTIPADPRTTATGAPPRRPGIAPIVDESTRPLLLNLTQVARWLRTP
jgi:hypothetical protein